ncbi:hypothetical protein EV714DRAFT_180776, partial [Schizophyllum commune]
AAINTDKDLTAIGTAFDTIQTQLHVIFLTAQPNSHPVLDEASIRLLSQILVVFGEAKKLQEEGMLGAWLAKLGASNDVPSALAELSRVAKDHQQLVSALTLHGLRQATTFWEYAVACKSLISLARLAGAPAKYASELLRTKFSDISANIVGSRSFLESIQVALLRQTTNQELQQQTENIQKIFQWLSYPDSSVKLNRLLKDRAHSTGSWFLDGDIYSTFKLKGGRAIVLEGTAGCGKSTIVAAAIRDLRAFCASSGVPSLTLYHLFDVTNNTQPQKLRSLLCSLLCQLAHQRNDCASSLTRIRKDHMSGYSQVADDLLRSHLVNLLQSLRSDGVLLRVFIAVDAVDEADKEEIMPGIISFLQELNECGNVSLLLSIRSGIIFAPDLDKLSNAAHIFVTKDLVDSDINTLLYQRLESTSQRGYLARGAGPELRDEIKETLKRGADGSFRWTALKLQWLDEADGNYDEIHQRLQTAPTTLSETYDHELGLIAPANRDRALRVITWVLYSHWPMSRADLAHILSFDYSEGIPCYDGRRRPSEDQVITTVGTTFLIADELDRVRFAHASVREHLAGLPLHSSFRIDCHLAYSRMARICLAHI